MGMIWLRVSLNERNLQTTLTTLLAEKQTILKFYDDHAFLRDEEKSSVLPTSAAGLGSVIFALTVCTDARSATPPRQEDKRYSPTPHYSIHSRNGQASPLITHSHTVTDPHRQMTYKTDPLVQSEKISTFSSNTSSRTQPATFLQGDFTPEPVINAPAREIARKESRRRKRNQKSVIQFGDDSGEIVQRHKQKVDEWSGALSAEVDLTPQGVNNVSLAHSGCNKNGIAEISPESNHTPDLSDRSSQLSLSDSEDLRQFVGELSSSPSKPIYTNQEGLLAVPAANQLRASTQEALDATAIALGVSTIGTKPIIDEEIDLAPSHSLSEMSRGDLEKLMVAMSKQNERIGEKCKQQQVELDHEQMTNGMLRDEIELEKSEMKRREDELAMKVSSISRENDLLKGQLKKYVGIVQSIEIKDSMGVPRDVSLVSPPIFQEENNEDDEKILQLSDMYGELMELNERLHRDLILKNRAILCMQNTMLSLGIQLPTFQAPQTGVQHGNQFESEGILTREIVKIWIPSAFLREDTYHVYQIYIRIHSDEWNVYRRYTEFHEFHLQLRKKVPIMDKFEFPPKKNIGRRDAKLVEDRRQRLQNYLRYMVHILSNTMSPSKPPLFTESLNKQKFLQLLPFFADPPVLNSNSRTASPALGHCPGGRRSSTQLPAPPRSPTYKGL